MEEIIDGFDIPKRELTEEEATRDITLERFNNFHYSAGEDFCDQVGYIIDHKVLGGWFLHKYPAEVSTITEVCNDRFGEALGFQELDVYTDPDGHTNFDLFYTDLAEFINVTTRLKRRVNQILIQVDEYYER